MLAIGILGLNFKTADLQLREAIARVAQTLSSERVIFFRYSIVVLSTCNRTEIYFSGDDLAKAHSDLLAFLRTQIDGSFEHRLYSYFGIDCFVHLCRVAAGLDSAILAESEIQRQVKVAYAKAKRLPSCMHFAFQKALKVSKLVRRELECGSPKLYQTMWKLTEWQDKQILLVGYSEINRGFLSFIKHKGIEKISLCTKNPALLKLEGIDVYDRSVLQNWQRFDIVVCASRAENYLIHGRGEARHCIFDLSVPRNVDPQVGETARLYNIDQFVEQNPTFQIQNCDALIWDNVMRLCRIYQLKTQHALESGGMESHL